MRRRPLRVPLLLALSLSLTPVLALAQTPEEIQAARDLFGDALKDEQAKHFDAALVKFRQVQKVKDTPQVRYRIASCLLGTGHLREAHDAFGEIHAQGGTPEEQDVERSAQAQMKLIAPRLPDVAVRITGPAIGNAIVTVDGQPARPGQPVSVDPGEHVIVIAGTGVKRNETRAAVDEGAHLVLTLQAETDPAWGGAGGHDNPPPPPPPPPPPDRSKMYGYIGFGVGAALLVGTVVTIVLREGQISTVKNDCPGNVCPTTKKNEVDSARSTANTELPVAVVLGAGAAIATGVGAYFFFRPTAQTKVTAAPTAGGAAMFLTHTF